MKNPKQKPSLPLTERERERSEGTDLEIERERRRATGKNRGDDLEREKATKQVTDYEARILKKWSRTRTRYFLGTCTLGVLLHAYPRCT